MTYFPSTASQIFIYNWQVIDRSEKIDKNQEKWKNKQKLALSSIK